MVDWNHPAPGTLVRVTWEGVGSSILRVPPGGVEEFQDHAGRRWVNIARHDSETDLPHYVFKPALDSSD